jgi:enoyl-CoA hydratase/carnithine racemase
VTESILLERREKIATIILNRPEQRNAINTEMWVRLGELACELDADPEVRVVILRGADAVAFSAGGDIHEFETARYNSVVARDYARVFEGAMDAFEAIGKPTISLIRGFCVGGGLELSTATDIRIASEDARFGIPIAHLGVLVGYKEMKRLVVLVGAGVASDLLLTARLINAAEALRVGLVSQVLPADKILSYTDELADQMTKLAPLSARWHKQILKTVLDYPGLEGLTPAEQAVPFACFDTEDFREGRRALVEKRTPHFKGI